MNLNAISEVNWIVSNVFRSSFMSNLLKSINIDFDHQNKSFSTYLNELNEMGDDFSIIKIINVILQNPSVKSLYDKGEMAWNFNFEFVNDHVDNLFKILKSEGYKIESLQVKIDDSIKKIAPPTFKFVENRFIRNKFYYDLVNDFNEIYRSGFFWLLPFILRKILENYLIDILRKKYGMPNITLFYRKSQGRFEDFSKLISNFKTKINDFKPYSAQIKKIIPIIEDFRETGNSAVHSIDILITKESIDEKNKEINHVINFLDNLLKKIEAE